MFSKAASLILVLTALLYSQKDFRIISSDQNSIIIEYTPQFLDTSISKINNQSFRNTEIAFGYFDESMQPGMPAIPERRIVIGVPSEFGNAIRILSSSYKELIGNVTPLPTFVKEKFQDGTEYKISPDYYNYVDFPELVSFGDFGIVRGLSTQDIRIFPVKFDVNSNTIKLYSKIVFQIDYGVGQFSGKKSNDEPL